MGGGYTANKQTYVFKTYTRHTQTHTHTHTKEWEKREREREIDRETKTMQIRRYLGLSVFQKLESHVEYFSKITTCDMFSRNPVGSLQNAGLPILKSPPWDLVTTHTPPIPTNPSLWAMGPPAPQKLSTKTDPPGQVRKLPSSGFGDALFGSATGVRPGAPGAPCPLPTSPEIDAAGLTN